MRFVVCTLLLCACGRLNFDGGPDAGAALSITSPAENATVRASAAIAGRCASNALVEISGDATATTDCVSGAYAVEIAFADPDGAKTVVVTQGSTSVTRTFLRVTPDARSSSGNSVPSAGLNVDCDLVIQRPPNVQAGDVLVGMIFTDGGLGASVSTPGFTRLDLSKPAAVAFYKTSNAAEPATYTFRIVAGTGQADTCEAAGVVVALRNVVATVVAQSQNQTFGTTTLVGRSVTSPGEALLVGAWGSNGPSSGITAPSSMRVADAARSQNGFANAMITFEVVGDGPTGDRTATIDAARDGAAALFLLNLTP